MCVCKGGEKFAKGCWTAKTVVVDYDDIDNVFNF